MISAITSKVKLPDSVKEFTVSLFGLNSRKRIQILSGLLVAVTLYTTLHHFINSNFSFENFYGINATAALLGVLVFAPLYIIPLLAIYHLKLANQKLRSTYKIMMRTEKMLRKHNEELELGRLQLADMAHKDRLTGLKNRRQFDALFGKYFQSAECGVEEFALILIDLNDFKPINDNHGHASGDSLLREVGIRLREICRGYRSDVFRLGGDEFAVLVKTDAETELNNLRNAIDEILAQPYCLADLSINMSAAIGVTRYDDQISTQDLFVQADRKLYAEMQEALAIGDFIFDEQLNEWLSDIDAEAGCFLNIQTPLVLLFVLQPRIQVGTWHF